ncbi:MAG: glycosyltransferase [Alphaproteobacteria bacterium]|nr:glycosyltransferase [Alphaproteobacteria bacterium]
MPSDLRSAPDDLNACFAVAATLAVDGRTAAAIAAFEAVVTRWPDVTVAWANLGVLRRRAGLDESAIDAFARAAALQPSEPSRHAALAQACHAAGWMERAMAAMRRQAVLCPGDPEAAYNIGITAPLVGTRQAARRWLCQATIQDPSRAGAWLRLSRIATRLGSDDEAWRALRRSLVLAPGSTEAWGDRVRAFEDHAAAPRLIVIDPDDDEVWVLAARGAADPAETARWLARFQGREVVADATVRLARQLDLPEGRRWRTRYERWIERYEISDARAVAAEIAGWNDPPTIDLLMPVCDPPVDALDAAIASVRAQSYPHWRLCIADDASTDPAVHAALDRAAAADARIRLFRRTERGHISAASNTALGLSDAPYVGFLDHDDALAEHALFHVVRELRAHPGIDFVYSDSDLLDQTGTRHSPVFKPDFDPYLVRTANYVCHFAVYRRDRVEALGGLREGYEGAQDHDLILRLMDSDPPPVIRHIPRVLYHWRAVPGSTAGNAEAKPYAAKARDRALTDHLARTTPGAAIASTDWGPRVIWPLPDSRPRVSVIVATKDGHALLRRCVDGVLGGTDWPNLELIVLDNGSRRAETRAYLDELAADERATVLRRPGPFNFSALMNDGAARASGSVLAFLNDDVEPLHRDWLEDMVRHALRQDVGAVGAKLFYPDRTVQHAGIILIPDYVARHIHVRLSARGHGYMARAQRVQTLSAVTGACLVMRRSVFETVGGFDAERLAVDYSDIDLCLRAGTAGFRTVWTPFARLIHHESATRGGYLSVEKRQRWEEETAAMRARWAARIANDPYYNPNLTVDPEETPFDLAFPPRLGQPNLEDGPVRD